MSTESQSGDDLRDRITNFLRRNFPQIQMHGGSSSITHLDREEGVVHIQLGGACSGCGISPMTIQAIKTRMTQEIPEIDTVIADTGMDGGGHGGAPETEPFPGEDTAEETTDDTPEAPF